MTLATRYGNTHFAITATTADTAVKSTGGLAGALSVLDVGTTMVISVYDGVVATPANEISRWVSAMGAGVFPIGLYCKSGIRIVVTAGAAGSARLFYE